ncbi:amidohydrolase family protein [Pusillimonas sp. MFBS29]|uniref:amidohydrolase family protein n=1 Tax=Pusillimonas sp. MFBS29 TaxID=2886690 RepID=UPI001D109EA4|nr:amidohydrolase family protein [Pusillimonas sp. MFBS29]MCC2594747.1 amidohydrolase family protein [Pusillimonas sp. MFBS29]
MNEPRPLAELEPVLTRLPDGACDTHTHIFGPAARFPFAPERPYTPHDAPFDALLGLHKRLGIARGVLVQPGCHGYDLTAVLDALSRGKGQYRAVALLRSDVTADELARLERLGVRGVRFNFMAHLQNTPWDEVQQIARMIAPLGWHICIHSDSRSLPELLPRLKDLPVPFVLDHMGRVSAAHGIDAPLFQDMLALAGNRSAWIKVSGIDRISTTGKRPFDDGYAFVRALIQAMPDQLLWGSDWPHPNVQGEMPDDGQLLNTFLSLCPDVADRKRILVDNPQQLYRFDESVL